MNISKIMMTRPLEWKLFSSFCSWPPIFHVDKNNEKKLAISLVGQQLVKTYLNTRTPRTEATTRMRIQMTATTTWAPPLASWTLGWELERAMFSTQVLSACCLKLLKHSHFPIWLSSPAWVQVMCSPHWPTSLLLQTSPTNTLAGYLFSLSQRGTGISVLVKIGFLMMHISSPCIFFTRSFWMTLVLTQA